MKKQIVDVCDKNIKAQTGRGGAWRGVAGRGGAGRGGAGRGGAGRGGIRARIWQNMRGGACRMI